MKNVLLIALVGYTFFYLGKGVGIAFTTHYFTEVDNNGGGVGLCS